MPDVYVTVGNAKYCRSEEHDGFVIDYDSLGNVTGVEVRNALSVDIDGASLHVTAQQTDDCTGPLGDNPPAV